MRIPLVAVVLLWIGTATAQDLPMPPRFSATEAPAQILGNYPLGVITELAAFSHHGQPDHKITLSNNRKGWIYEVFMIGKKTSYVQPGGSQRIVRETDYTESRSSFTLIFGTDGTVIDVLYDDLRTEIGLSALQVQHRSHPATSKWPGFEHGSFLAPGKPRE